MGYLADIYVIKKTRSKEEGLKFLDHFLPYRTESSEVYELPQYGKEVLLELQKAEQLMEHLEQHPTEPHRIDWYNEEKEQTNKHAMLFYTRDGHLIFGISRLADSIENTSNEDQCLREMNAFLGTTEGYITYECAPEDTYEDFLKLVK